MQALSASLLLEQLNQDGIIPYRIIELQRRYWTGSAFAWEAAINISQYVKKVSTAKWKLDTRGFGEWKSPSFQVDLDNRRNFWSEDEPRGAWRLGLGTQSVAYSELSRIRVRLGQVLPDGTLEDVYCFGGLINKPLADHEDDRTITASCVGLDELLRRKSAEALSTTVTDELLGSTSGSVFTTAQLGVGVIEEIKRGLTSAGAAAATVLVPDTDYSLSNLNEKTLGCEVTLTAALTAGNSVWITYKYWYQDKELHWIVEQLLILAGIPDYQVDPAIFSTNVLNTWTQTSSADFDAGVKTNIDTATPIDAFKKKWHKIDDFSDLDLTANPAWSVFTFAGATAVASSGALVLSNPGGGSAQIQLDSNVEIPGAEFGTLNFDATVAHSGDTTGSSLSIHCGGGGLDAIFSFNFSNGRVEVADGIPGTGFRTTYLDCGAIPAGTHNWRFVIISQTSFEVFKDNVSVGICTTWAQGFSSTTHNVRVRSFAFAPNGGQTCTATLDNFYWTQAIDGVSATSSATAVEVSQVLDATAGVESYGLLTYNFSPNGGSVLIETLSSTDAGFTSPDPMGWMPIGVTGQITSDVRRYLKVRFTFTTAALPSLVSPEVQDYSVHYYTSTTTIPLVDMTNKSCYTAIQECAKYPGYEIGFSANEEFFYRARASADTSLLTISKSTNLRREISFNNGTDQIYTRVKATFGDYRVTIDSDILGEAHPNAIDKYGEQEFSVSSTLIPKQGANIADAAARSIYAYTSAPRKRAQVDMKMLIQYELGDRVTYQREHKDGRWLWGTPDYVYGQDDDNFLYHGDPASNGWDLAMRIEGIELETNPKAIKLRYDLVEIL